MIWELIRREVCCIAKDPVQTLVVTRTSSKVSALEKITCVATTEIALAKENEDLSRGSIPIVPGEMLQNKRNVRGRMRPSKLASRSIGHFPASLNLNSAVIRRRQARMKFALN